MFNNFPIPAFNNWLRFISVGVFLISLTQTSYCTESSCGESIACLLSGSVGFLMGGAALTWLANPLLFISWYNVYKNPGLSLKTSVAATIIALSFLFFNKVMADEAGNYSKIISYGWGYWLWVSSALLMLIGNLYSRISAKE